MSYSPDNPFRMSSPRPAKRRVREEVARVQPGEPSTPATFRPCEHLGPVFLADGGPLKPIISTEADQKTHVDLWENTAEKRAGGSSFDHAELDRKVKEDHARVKRGAQEVLPVLYDSFCHINTEFGGGHYSEKHYQKGLAAELEVHGFSCQLEVMVPLNLNRSDGVACFVGFGYADMLITSPQGHMSLLELKMGTPTDLTIGAARRQARTYRSHLCQNGHDILNTFIVFFPKDCPITNPRLYIMKV